jgi:hypothetical protein
MSERNYREWVLYFAELDKLGISYGLREMADKANELELEIPIRNRVFSQ